MSQLATHYPKILNDETALRSKLELSEFEPQPEHILVEPLPPESQVGLIHIPEKHQKPQAVAVVLTSGAGAPYAPGDVVFFNGYGRDLNLEGRKLKTLYCGTTGAAASEVFGCWRQASHLVKMPE